MKLYFREFGSYSDKRPTLIFLHGLFGSSSNWQSIARSLEREFHIIVPDLRNHGHSPHAQSMSYPAMGEDLAELIDDHGLDSALVIGHSMGGKAGMLLALEQPRLVAGLVVVDIAPVPYSHEFDTIFLALRSVGLDSLEGRTQADQRLAGWLPERSLRQYLLQNLTSSDGGWQWRINLDVLIRDIDQITDFPESLSGRQYPGATLFIHGGNSDYLRPEYRPRIERLFPAARLHSIEGAGHWVYAELQQPFLAALEAFLSSR